MATEDETGNHENEGGPGLGGSAEQSKEGQKDRESANPDGTKGNRKKMSSGESSGKVGGSRQGTQENKEGRNKDRGSPGNSEGAVSKKVRVTDARRKLAEIDKRTAEYKARLIEAMMIGNTEGCLQEVPRDERKTSQGGIGQGDKDSDRGGTPSKRRKERENSPGMEAEKATNPLATYSRAIGLPTSPAVSRGCEGSEGLWSLRERELGWFDPEGTAKTRGGQKASKEGVDTSMAGEASSSEGGLRKIVSSLTRGLNKNQGYLADVKKKLTFDGANITEFLIDYENLVALLKWTEEEKMDHLGQHVSLSLGRDIMAIVAATRSWEKTRDVMMRKYLAAEKMATEADLAAVQRKNFATYNDFLREFTLVALRIPGVTDRIMSKYFLRQFSEFDKDKIMSAYQQTSKFVNTRDVDFSTVTDLTEKTVVTETLALLKEGESIDLTAGSRIQKTDKISQWPTPLRTTTEVRAFLGVVDFWRIFIKNFAKIAETVALSAPCFNDEVGRPFILETDGGPLAMGGVLIQRDEGGKERSIRFESRTLNSAERQYSQFKKEVLVILHCLKTFQAYLFGRRFILTIDPTNVAGALKNYRPIDSTVRWVGFIWQFDYKIERIVGIRNKAEGLSRVCITPEEMEDAEPIDAILEYEGGTLTVDNEMMSKECISRELLIQTLEKRAPAIVAELREGSVTTRGRREENGSWGAIVGPKEELMAMAVEGGREAVMSLVESWKRKELQWVVNQMQEGKDGGKEGEEFFCVQPYEGLFRAIGLLLVGNKQPTEVGIKAREEAKRYILDARDNLSGFVKAVALKKKTGRSVTDLIEDFYLRHPFVRRLIADNETEIVN
ncbi:hypothetical protein CBR_g8561 [Chara braunii]|uniref:Reverse transcriptase RNase H-like domain-containing protein n=1 Tax=Chara braunii TaxID=69332 RepID=A0A388JRY9_CHABU|nr:hypothetical protein CBR_g8561 [Chara braunii]|eukprot:GBG60537.1 hypothetical protein CBR_g8561 [Chara braunii]